MSNKAIANRSGACCLRGTIHQGEAKGEIIKIADVDTYIATPSPKSANGNVVLYFPDVYGLFINGAFFMSNVIRKNGVCMHRIQ